MTVRLVPLLLALSICGCLGGAISTPMPKYATPINRKPLTAAEKATWQAYCQRLKRQGRDGMRLAALMADGSGWKVRYHFVDCESRKDEYTWEFGPGGSSDEKSCRKDAAILANDIRFRCTAVLDLCSGDAPRFIAWYHDNGRPKIQVGTTAPTPEIEAGANQYLLDLQRRAGELR